MGCARYTWETVRRYTVRVFWVIALTVGLLSILAACYLPPTSARTPPFRFLGGQSPIREIHDSAGGGGRRSHYTYSVPGNVQEICAAAQSELSALGYGDVMERLDNTYPMREYRLRQGPSGEVITVRVISSLRLRVYSTPKNSQYSSPDRYGYQREADWVSAEIDVYRGPSWLQRHITYPVRNVLWRMGLSKGQ
jgi:hypothetical protein